MVRWRRFLRPVCPTSLRNFAKTLKSEEWKHLLKYNKKFCLTAKIIKIEGKLHLLLYDRNFIRILCNTGTTEEIFADATYKSATILLENKNKGSTINKNRQLFTLMVRKFNHVSDHLKIISEQTVILLLLLKFYIYIYI